jgi:lipoprotein-anchoring transpeptidase ErfK/SrfK
MEVGKSKTFVSIKKELSHDKVDKKTESNINEESNYLNTNDRFNSNIFNSLKNGNESLSIGSKGEKVREIKQALIDLGFWTGGSIEENQNGTYGKSTEEFDKKTEDAVKNFQDSRGLPKTGIIDSKTMNELIKVAPARGETLWSPSYAKKSENVYPSNILPNGQKARIVVDLSEHRLFLFKENSTELEKVYSIASGKISNKSTGATLTPPGIRIIDVKLNNPSWLGKKLWNDKTVFGSKLIGLGKYDLNTKEITNIGTEIHGTNNPNSIGTNASHGCIRMLNSSIEDLYRKVKVGDIVFIQK